MDAVLDWRIDRECERFLYREAELLDARRFHDWLALLSPSIDYRVPVRTTRENKDGAGFSDRAFFMEEDYASLKMRVLRLDSDFAWAENPATRTRRLVGNVRAQAGSGADECSVASNMAVYCFRGESAVPITLTGERRDLLRRIDGQWRLHARLVLLDTTVLGMEALSIFL
jgi:3-phenylpropionate/cinnamic acid dioxygenase small subunit